MDNRQLITSSNNEAISASVIGLLIISRPVVRVGMLCL